jgi:phospholipid/cholesterol/gamma-HCH transport system permease protein
MVKTDKSSVSWDLSKKSLICQGEWDLHTYSHLESALQKISLPSSGEITLDGAGISKMDSSGAWLLIKWMKKISNKKLQPSSKNFSEAHQKLIDLIEKQATESIHVPKLQVLGRLAQFGKSTLLMLEEAKLYLAFVGQQALEWLRILNKPAHWRIRETVSIIYKTGYQALPIIALLAFLIGVVIAYQMALQLRKYGANVFVVDLIGLSVLREFGPLLTAIMVAGRTGSSFTAQLGTMSINQEIDALNTMGVTPSELLLLPRILGLFIVLPLLTIWADFFGVVGGMIMTNNMLNINWHDFILRFQQQIPLRTLLIGLGKAPVFALIIASIGCFQGTQVRESAENVGRLTTRSVVLSIFFIIVADAAFSIIFSKLKL